MILTKNRLLIAMTLVFVAFSHTTIRADSHCSTNPGDGFARQCLEQGWSSEIRERFWFTSQGSRILPYDWFLALEQADSNQLFRDNDHMEALRYLPQAPSSLNPDGLPIGFVADVDTASQEKWLGLTCAACHTNQIDYQGTQYLIEGGPTLADFVGFFDRLVDSLNATNDNDEKFARFTNRLLGDNTEDANKTALKTELGNVAHALTVRRTVNSLPNDYPADFTSFARLDAFGNIENAASALALGNPNNRNAPTAPVSYPFLWSTHQSDVVQWNGSAANETVIGPLVRNIGEVVGVFGGLEINDPNKSKFWRKVIKRRILKHDYPNTVDLQKLVALETWVADLRSPRWSETSLPAIDQDKADRGADIFSRTTDQGGCVACHEVITRENEGKRYKANMITLSEVGTDPAMASNAACHQADSLTLEGEDKYIRAGERLDKRTTSINLAVNGVVGIALEDVGATLDALKAAKRAQERAPWIKRFSGKTKRLHGLIEEAISQRRNDASACDNGVPNFDKLRYKARPLNGIWATAPYLHNGSVPTLSALLQKPEDRPAEFGVGNREFDPINVGYVDDNSPSRFKVFKSGGATIQPGNSNRGHNYGTSLTNEEKLDLIEYLKSL